MMDIGFLIIIGVFLLYYFLVLFNEKKIISEPGDIIDKFLSVTLLYAGISIIYFSITGRALFSETEDSYKIYIFIIGFISVLWTIPNLLKEFEFFQNFISKGKKKKK